MITGNQNARSFKYIIEKGRDLTQSYDKSPYTHRKIQKATWQHKNATKNSITQQLRTNSRRSVGITTATQLVWLTGFKEYQPSHSMQQHWNQINTALRYKQTFTHIHIFLNLLKIKWNTLIHYDHISITSVWNLWIILLWKNKRNAHSITQQLRHRLQTVNCSGNRQQPHNWCS